MPNISNSQENTFIIKIYNFQVIKKDKKKRCIKAYYFFCLDKWKEEIEIFGIINYFYYLNNKFRVDKYFVFLTLNVK